MGKADRGAWNLSGVWQGEFSYPRNRPPIAFLARLTENDTWIHGVTEEKGAVGDARGLTISASLQGRRSGREVTWLKLYDACYRGYDAVQYGGEINEDGTQIFGRWTIHANWSGRFLMVRAKASVAMRSREAVESL
jgi:hypothetical protein